MLEVRKRSDYDFEFIDTPTAAYEIPTDTEFYNIMRFDELDLRFEIAGDQYRCANFAPEVFEFFHDFIAKSKRGNSEFAKSLRESGGSLSISERASKYRLRFFSYPQQREVWVNFGRNELSDYLKAFVTWYEQAVSSFVTNAVQAPKFSEKIYEFRAAIDSFSTD